jgi:hypothetical protein
MGEERVQEGTPVRVTSQSGRFHFVKAGSVGVIRGRDGDLYAVEFRSLDVFDRPGVAHDCDGLVGSRMGQMLRREDFEVAQEDINGFTIKDSGERKNFSSGMVRDVTTGKIQYHRVMDGPMFKRWAEHLTKGAAKYPDVKPGVPNWTLAQGEEELHRFKESALRHFVDWYNGRRDEDHAAGVFFNINGAEYVREKITKEA